ncbi:multicellular organismal development [Nesidiocoris tenuis]|uniref:Multicellular organismal development n=2 Tax=Nesidiocoris tenuis TaxID=355587 RepID=A0ABN7AVD7_9HEMI|nr:multicellular organismal development [Nesidiocoris tenuis]
MVNTRSASRSRTPTPPDDPVPASASEVPVLSSPGIGVAGSSRTLPLQGWEEEKQAFLEEIRRTVKEQVQQVLGTCMTEFTSHMELECSSCLGAMSRLVREGMSSVANHNHSLSPSVQQVGQQGSVSLQLKPKPYDGSSDWAAYKLQFETIAAKNGWDADTKAAALEAALSAPAVEILTEVEVPRTYDRLSTALEARYGHERQSKRYMTELLSRKQQAKEDIATYHRAVSTLVRRAFPGLRCDGPVEEMVVYNFMQGIRDPNLRDKVFTAWPATMEEALAVSLRHETVAQAAVPILARRGDVRLDEEDFTEVAVRRTTQPMRPEGQTQQRFRSQQNLVCWRCSNPGHIARNCPYSFTSAASPGCAHQQPHCCTVASSMQGNCPSHAIPENRPRSE